MKYRKDGRTYRLDRKRNKCYSCEFYDMAACPSVGGRFLCLSKIGGYWRETLWSKIRNWRRK